MARRAVFQAAALTAVIGALCLCASQARAQERLQITAPLDAAYVTRVISVKGTVKLGVGEVLVILARHAEYGWWYQGQTERSGRFEIEPVIVGSPGDPRGTRFSIAAFIVSAEQASRMKSYRAQFGLSVSPEKMITVYRL